MFPAASRETPGSGVETAYPALGCNLRFGDKPGLKVTIKGVPAGRL